SRNFGLTPIAFLIFLSLAGCTKEVSVDSGEYGVLVRYGEIVGHVKGPGSINTTPFIETVIHIDVENEILLSDGKYKIRYKVIDPEKFLAMTGSQKGGFKMLLEREIAKQAMQGKD